MTYKILTFYLTKDTINQKCYESVMGQKGVEQDIIVVSARRIEIANNFVVKVPQEYPLPVRVGVSINRALAAYWNDKKYNYFFKVDNDVSLPSTYLLDLISKGNPIIGPGNAMLAEANFFKKYFGNRWAITYCDDEYMKACAFAQGLIDQVWEKGLNFDSEYRPSLLRGYGYGKEYYKFGVPFWFIFVRVMASIKNYLKHRPDRIPITIEFYTIGGHISAFGTKKYEWHHNFAKRWTLLYLQKFRSKLNRALGKYGENPC